MAAGTLDDFYDFLEDDALEIPNIKSRAHPEGKTYNIPSPDAETGMRLSALAEIAVKVNKSIDVNARDVKRLQLDDTEEREFAQQVLGPVYEELIEDGVSWVRLQRITQYAYVHFAFSPEAAREAAERGVFAGKAQARTRAERRAKPSSGAAPKAPPASTGSRARKKK